MENEVKRKKDIKHFRDLEVYQKAFGAAMRIYQITKSFPVEEKYSLTDQIRRSSRAWRKRKYAAVFKNKLTDSMQEASETQSWLEFCLSCKYIEKPLFDELDNEYEGIILMINAMEKNAQKFCF